MTIRINTRFFAISLRAGFFRVRLGSHVHGLEAKAARLGSFVRLNWGVASYTHIFKKGLACYFIR